MKFFSSQFYKTVALLSVLTALLAPQALAADGGASPNTDNKKPTGGTSIGGTTEAQRKAYAAVDLIAAPDLFCRRDIGWREVAREAAGD